MDKNYNSMEEVRQDLKILRLKRDISLAELESKKIEVEESFAMSNILSTVVEGVKKYGVFFLIKKLFRL